MKFEKFNKQIEKQFDVMCKTGMLFRSNVSGNELWNLYLSSFEDEKIFRDPESSEHNCNCCKNFISRYGNIVSISKNGKIETLFSNIGDVGKYSKSVNTVDLFIKSMDIKDVPF